MKKLQSQFLCLPRTVICLILLISGIGNGQSWGQINENIQSWTPHNSYGNYTQEINAGTVIMEACVVQIGASATGDGSAGRIQMQASNGIVELPLLPSVGTVEIALAAGSSNRSLTLQYLTDSTWTNLITWTGISSTGTFYSYEMNVDTPTRLRLFNPSHTVYVHDIHVDLHPTAPVLMTSTNQLNNLNYMGSGPSAAQSFVLSGANLNGSNLSLSLPGFSAFQLSESEQTAYSQSLLIPAYDGSPKQIYVRLAAGLDTGVYNDVMTISGGGAADISVNLSGSVLSLPSITDATATGMVGSAFYYSLQTTGNPFAFAMIAGVLPEGLSLDVENGTISGIPEEAGNYDIQVTATNAAGLSLAATISLQIAKGIQTISLNDVFAQTGGADILLPAVSNEGISMGYVSDNTAVVVVSGNILTIAGAGTAVVTASNAGNDNYEAFIGTFTVNVNETSPVTTSSLFFSEYIEGSSDNKYIEIFNGTGTTVDLSEYTVELYSNGAGTPSNTQTLGTLLNILPAGEVMVIRNNDAGIHNSLITTYASSVCNFNGDDALVLKRNGIIIDIIGQIGCDPGTKWTADGGLSTLDKTLIRRPEVCSGITVNPSDSCGVGSFPTLATEWVVLPQNAASNLGIHTTDCNAVPAAPTITLGAVSSGICVNVDNIISIAYSAQHFEGSPTFTAQVSNASGDFTLPVASETGTSPILLSVPADALAPGTYQIRVISGMVQSDTAILFARAKPNGNITALNGSMISEPMCAGTEAVVKFTATAGLAPFSLTFNDGATDYIKEQVSAENGIPTEVQIEASVPYSRTYTLTKIQDANGCIAEE